MNKTVMMSLMIFNTITFCSVLCITYMYDLSIQYDILELKTLQFTSSVSHDISCVTFTILEMITTFLSVI